MLSSMSFVSTPSTGAGAAPEDSRRVRLLEAALGVFLRYGYKKTSMDEVARAADLSRQGLYLHFATKEELFRATVELALRRALDDAAERLRDPALSIEQKLVRAFDEWQGRYVGMMQGHDVAELIELRDTLLGSMFTEYERQFGEAVTRAIRGSGLPAAYKGAGVTARQLAETLYATALGLKHSSASRAAFVDAFTVAVRVMCAPATP
jgi:AcrR family transcriptional regulator